MAASSASSLIVTPDESGTIALTYSAPAGTARPGAAPSRPPPTKLPGLLATTGYLPDGLPVLREILAQRYTDGGLPTEPEQIIVTSGAMGAISLLARLALEPGQRVVVEGVSYPHAHESFTAAGARLSALPVDRSPWDVDALASILAGGAAPRGVHHPRLPQPHRRDDDR